jgi:carbon storage regulator
MLVLSRREGERILIGPDVVVTVLNVRGDRVRLGIEAPPELLIVREELGHKPAEAAQAVEPCRGEESPYFPECA